VSRTAPAPNNPVERTAHSVGSVFIRGSVPVGRRSPGAFGLVSIVRVASGPCLPRPGALPHLHVLTLYISLDNIPAIGTRFVRHGITFVRDNNKASTNLRKHGMPFEQAAQAFFDPFL